MRVFWLQNPADKREIYCDDKLKTIFEGKDKVGFLEIGKLLSGHFVKANWLLMKCLTFGTWTSRKKTDFPSWCLIIGLRLITLQDVLICSFVNLLGSVGL